LEQSSIGPHRHFCVSVTIAKKDILCIYAVFFLSSGHTHLARTHFSILQLRWKSHIFGQDGDLTYLDRIAAAAQETTDLHRLDWLGQDDLVTTLIEGRKAANVPNHLIARSRNQGTIHNEATIIRLAAQGHTNEGIATLLGTTEGTIKNRRQRIRRWLTALAERNGVADLVEAWDRSGGNHFRATQIQAAYRHGKKPEVAFAA